MSETSMPGTFLGTRASHISGDRRGGFDLLAQLENVTSKEHRIATEQRVERLENIMGPLFNSLPKNSTRLDANGLRYLLGRVFVERHGWFVIGLRDSVQLDKQRSPTAMLDRHDDVEDLFEDHLSTRGFDLHQSAVFAATLEHFVHIENIQRLEAAYRALDLAPTDDQLSEGEVEDAMKAYMMIFILERLQGRGQSSFNKTRFRRLEATITKEVPSWPDIVVFVKEVRKTVIESDDVASAAPTSWSTTLKALEQVGERYGRWQDKECHKLKQVLSRLGDSATGRVPLDHFYSTGLSSREWLFFESVPYLRELGALDETDPNVPALIIPNYVNAHSNCLASSTYYNVCCINECNALMSHLEAHIAAPYARAEDIVELVEGLSSDTIKAPRVLQGSLVRRLSEIAMHHEGVVPLYGRLFAQWMHRAFPSECPFPHISGTTRQITAKEFKQDTGIKSVFSQADILAYLRRPEKKDSKESEKGGDIAISHDDAFPWSTEEELFVSSQALPKTRDSKARDSSRPVWRLLWRLLCCMALALIALSFLTSRVSSKKLGILANEKHFV